MMNTERQEDENVVVLDCEDFCGNGNIRKREQQGSISIFMNKNKH